jgi:predicted Rossmann fold nucleotide-binding protein DprA/Smf involved in DNA uptake
VNPTMQWWLENTSQGRRTQIRTMPRSALMPRARAQLEEDEREEERRRCVRVAEYLVRQDVPRQARAIARYAGMTELHVRDALARLERHGLAEKTSDGLWRAVTDGSARSGLRTLWAGR